MPSSGRWGYLDTHPPAKLPNPSPSKNAVTTTVTDSMFTPYNVNSARCQTIWYRRAGKPEKKKKTYHQGTNSLKELARMRFDSATRARAAAVDGILASLH